MSFPGWLKNAIDAIASAATTARRVSLLKRLGALLGLVVGQQCVVRHEVELFVVTFGPDEVVRDEAGEIVSVPSCYHLEHRRGVCPHGHTHESVVRQYQQNTVLNNFFGAIADQLTGAASIDLEITRVALGLSSDPTTLTMNQLVSEFYRTTPTVIKQAPNVVVTFFFLGPLDGNPPSQYQEYCVLADGATDTPATGKALYRWLAVFDKNANNQLSGSHTLTMTNV